MAYEVIYSPEAIEHLKTLPKAKQMLVLNQVDQRGEDQPMKSIELSEVPALEPLIQSGSVDPVVVMKDGQVLAAIVPVDEADLESMLLSINPQFQAILERSQSRLENEGGLSSDEVRQKLGL